MSYLVCGLGLITDGVLQNDDITTMAAAMTQAKATGRNVTVTLTDGTHFTATPTDLDAGPSVATQAATTAVQEAKRTGQTVASIATSAAATAVKDAGAPAPLGLVLGLAVLAAGAIYLTRRK